MERIIKFRGLTANNEWVYGDLLHDKPNSTAYYKEYSQRICWINDKGASCNQPVKNGTVGQFTNVLDKNDVEIYNGDIVKTVYLGNECNARGAIIISPIEYFGSGFTLAITYTPIYPFIVDHTIEVIGDIYRNPELLSK